MNEQDKDNKLDDLLKKSVNSGNVEFNPEQWKQRYSREYAQLGRTNRRVSTVWRLTSNPVMRLAATVVIGIAVILLIQSGSLQKKKLKPMPVAKTEPSPTMMISRLSLTLAYNHGGLDAVDAQYKKAFRKSVGRPTKLSMADLLNENGGS